MDNPQKDTHLIENQMKVLPVNKNGEGEFR